MRFIQEEEFVRNGEQERLLVPFFSETDIGERLRKSVHEDLCPEAMIGSMLSGEFRTVLFPAKEGSLWISFLNLGSIEGFTLSRLKSLFQRFGRQVREDYQILLDGLSFERLPIQQAVETIVKAVYQGAYIFHRSNLAQAADHRIYAIREQLKKEKELTFTLICPGDLTGSIEKAEIYGSCINTARMLGDIPNNYLHVRQLAEYAKDLAGEYGLDYELLGNRELEELHSGGILGVNAGSCDEAGLITVSYEGTKGAPYTAIIGKGVMFDSGGYHLKSIDGMKGMRYDMCGAANILAALEIAVRLKSRQNILAVIPAVENLIGPSACKMGDVLTTMSGKTVEIYNTDAEGRLILCDAITWAQKKGAKRIIDMATLTYSCTRALGDKISGIFSDNEEFYEAFLKKTGEQCERVWRMPLDKLYHDPLHNTQTADLINYAPGSGAGASIAACFLEEFVDKDIPWIHLDIAGTAQQDKDDELQSAGATGILAASVAAFLE